MSTGEMVTAKEYGAAQAGERVGWTSVREYPREDAETIYVADIVTATVGQEGARVGYYEHESGNRIHKLVGSDCSEGFTAVSGLSMYFLEGQTEFHGSQTSYWRESLHPLMGNAGVLLFGAQDFRKYTADNTDAKWIEDKAALVDTLRSDLDTYGLEAYYPSIYYSYNLYSAISDDRQYRHDVTNPRELLLADPNMSDTTQEQVDTLQAIHGILEASTYAEDSRILAAIDKRSSDGLAELVPEFRSSRQAVARGERTIHELASRLYVPSLGHLPVGWRPGGRTWPYMDPEARDDERAFGGQIRALEAGHRQYPVAELEREVRELKSRAQHAMRGLAAAMLLQDVEIQLLRS